MNDFKLEVTDQYERLVKFFVENQLEFDGDEEVDTDIVKCWKAEAEDDKLAGGCVLALSLIHISQTDILGFLR